VVFVIFGFLGSGRATIVPAVAIPASIIGTFTVMALTGCSLNVLTLLGLVLAVGLVVDDAIIVLENIHRRIIDGTPPMQAAVEGTKEIGFAVLATTIALVTVFIPIAFLTGIVGRLFAELAIAVASAVLLSGFVALTLTPMMCSRLLRANSHVSAAQSFGERLIDRLRFGYRAKLIRAMDTKVTVVIIGIGASLASLALLFQLPSELAPAEDVGWFAGHVTAPQGSSIRYTDTYVRELESMIKAVPEVEMMYTVVARGERPTIVNKAASWVTLKDWSDRSRSQQEIVAKLNQHIPALTGVKAFLLNPASLSDWSEKQSMQVVIGGLDYQELERTARTILKKMEDNPGFISPELDLALDTPHIAVEAYRSKSADLGVSVSVIGRTLETLLSGRAVNTFTQNGRQYKVIAKVDDRRRERPSDISGLYVRGNGGELVQLDNVVTVKQASAPESLNHVDRMRAVTVSVMFSPARMNTAPAASVAAGLAKLSAVRCTPEIVNPAGRLTNSSCPSITSPPATPEPSWRACSRIRPTSG